jgi:biopolymer transport protein ExbD
MSAWFVRQVGSDSAIGVPSATEVLTGLRDGNWLPNDEVKGPTDLDWVPIERHPLFAEAAGEIEDEKTEAADETHLDMNPLIDVCLVLLIFFILTITYASLERAIDIPESNSDDKGPNVQKLEFKDIKDKVFVVTAKMEGEKAVIRIEKEEVPIDQLVGKIKQIVNSTGRREMVLDIDKDVPWGVETAILDAAKGNDIHNIMNNTRSGSKR